MKALQIQTPREARIVEVVDPVAGPGEVVVRVEAVSSCPHWDITMFEGIDIFDRPDYPKYPTIPGQPGHEMAGIVDSVGLQVSDFSPGDTVIAWLATGEDRIGSYAEKVLMPIHALLHRPPGLSAAETAGLEMAAAVAGPMLAGPPLSGKRVSIGGLGPAGLIAAQLAKAAGAVRVIGFDLVEERRVFSLTLGVDEAYDPRSEEGVSFAARPGSIADYAIDCSGNAASVQYQMDIVGKGVILFGVAHEPYLYQPRHWVKNLSLYGGVVYTVEAAQFALQCIESGALRLGPLNTVELPLYRFAEGTIMLKERRALKILYRP